MNESLSYPPYSVPNLYHVRRHSRRLFQCALPGNDAAVFKHPTNPVFWGLAILFSFTMDINIPTSKMGRPVFFVSVPLKITLRSLHDNLAQDRDNCHQKLGLRIMQIVSYIGCLKLNSMSG